MRPEGWQLFEKSGERLKWENRSDQLGRGKVGDWCDESKEKNVSRKGKSATFTGILFSPESDRKENH